MSNAHKGSRLLIKDAIYAVPFDAAHFDFNRDATGIQYGDLISPAGESVYTIRESDGKFGGAVFVEDSVQNLLSESIGMYNNFAATGGIITSASRLSEYYLGQPIIRNTYTPTADAYRDDIRRTYGNHGAVNSIVTYLSGNYYTASIYWRCNKPSVLVEGSPSNVGGWMSPKTLDVGGGWKRSIINMYNTISGGARDAKYWGFKDPLIETGETVTIDWVAPMVEQRNFATSYTPSSRAAGSLSYPVELLNPLSFTISCWVKFSGFVSNSYQPIFEFCAGRHQNNRLLLMLRSSNELTFFFGNATMNDSFITPFIPTVDKWHMITARYDGSTYSVFVDGNLVGSMSNRAAVTFTAGATMNIGGKAWGRMNGAISDFALLKTAASDEEIVSWFIANTPFYNPYDYRAFAY